VRPLSRLFWWEVVSAGMSGVVAAVTLVWPDWIELVFNVDPDGGDGSLEWLVAGLATAVTLTLCLAARREWRRVRTAR
jgi:hypothetical protein